MDADYVMLQNLFLKCYTKVIGIRNQIKPHNQTDENTSIAFTSLSKLAFLLFHHQSPHYLLGSAFHHLALESLDSDERIPYREIFVLVCSKLAGCNFKTNNRYHFSWVTNKNSWCRSYLCSQVGNRKSRILIITAEPATPTTTTHMIKKKRGTESDQKRLSLSLSSSIHWHTTCPHTIKRGQTEPNRAFLH